MGFSDGDGKPGSFAEQYTLRRESHLTSLQQKEEEMRQKFVIRVKEKEGELKEAEREVIFCFAFEMDFNIRLFLNNVTHFETSLTPSLHCHAIYLLLKFMYGHRHKIFDSLFRL